jgi:hypothetical protein
VISALIAPFDASGMVLRQNGISSWIETGVGLLSPMTLNWLFGKSCAAAVDAMASNDNPASNRFSIAIPLRLPDPASELYQQNACRAKLC